MLLLKVTLDYKTAKTMENINCESLSGLKLFLVAANTQHCSPPFWNISRIKTGSESVMSSYTKIYGYERPHVFG